MEPENLRKTSVLHKPVVFRFHANLPGSKEITGMVNWLGGDLLSRFRSTTLDWFGGLSRSGLVSMPQTSTCLSPNHPSGVFRKESYGWFSNRLVLEFSDCAKLWICQSVPCEFKHER